MTPEERRRKALELARETSAKAREFAREVYPTLRRQSQEIAREIGKKAEDEGLTEEEAHEAAVEELLARLREEFDRDKGKE